VAPSGAAFRPVPSWDARFQSPLAGDFPGIIPAPLAPRRRQATSTLVSTRAAGLESPLRLLTRAVSPPGAAVRWARAGGPKPRQPPGPAGKFCGVCGRLADSYCPDDAIRGQTVASIRLTALTRPRIASSWGAQAVRCGGLTTRPPRPRTAPWGTRWGQMDGHPAPPAFSRAARLAGSHLGASPTLVTDVPPLSYRMGSLGSPLRRPARGQG
jgi:hypothetical protein